MKIRRVLLDGELAPMAAELFRNAGMETDIVTPNKRLLKPLVELGGYSALLLSNRVAVPFDVLEAAGKHLKVIGVFGDDVRNIDTADASRQGILVKVTEYGNAFEAANLSLRLMATLTSRAFRTRDEKSALVLGGTGEQGPGLLTGFELAGSAVGLIGCGNVAQALAAALKPHCARVVGYDNNPRAVYENFHRRAPLEIPAIEYVQLSDLLERADVISIHTAGETKVFKGKELYFARRRPFIVNTSRSGTVDEEALLSALEEGRIRGAAITAPPEALADRHPPDWLRPYLAHANVVVAPEIGVPTADTQRKQVRKLARALINYLLAKDLSLAVNPMDVVAGRKERFPLYRGKHRSSVPIMWNS